MAPSPFTTTFDINTPISSSDMPDTVNPRDMTLADDVDSTPSESGTLATDTTSASPSNSSESMSKPAPKKRKKWGQVLPEPTTNLPPRKRAKTEEEKQQRKYERVKRNRQAAHNSRLRKQEEMDKLYAENNSLKQDLNNFRDEIARLQEENSRLQQQATQPRITTLAPDMSPSIADFTFPSDIKHIKQEPSSNVLTPPDSPRSVIDASKQSNDTHSAVDVGFADCGFGHPELGYSLDDGNFNMTFLQDLSAPQLPQPDLAFDKFVNCDALLDASAPIDFDMSSWQHTDNFDAATADVFDSFTSDTNAMELVQ